MYRPSLSYHVRCELWLRRIHTLVEKRLHGRKVKIAIEKMVPIHEVFEHFLK